MENRKEKNKKNNSLTALGVGFGLIILTALVFFIRSLPPKEDKNISDKINQKETIVGIPVSSKDLLKKIVSKEKLSIVDIRSKELFLMEHILDSKNISPADLEGFFKSAEKKSAYIIVDSSGEESSRLSYKISKDFDIPNIYYLEKGFDAWKSQLNPTVKEGDPTSFSDQSKVKYIKSDELKKFVDEGNRQIKIVDIRKQQAFSDGHIKDSMNMPSEEIEEKRSDLPRGKNLIIVDNDGISAFRSAVRLFDMGFFNILVLSDGLTGWKSKGYEIVK